MVHLVQQLITDYLKITLPHIRSLEYFSDACAGQYKNKRISIICANTIKILDLKELGTSQLLHTGNHPITELVEQ